MINTISDLLIEFIKKETEILNNHNIKHPTTIGSMFEGLTESIMNKSLFSNLNLKVVKNSFIRGCDTEFDVMLVDGNGTEIPYTGRYQFNAEEVIAIIQVKKNLFSKDIKDAYHNLQFIVDYYEPEKIDNYILRSFRDSFRSLVRKDLTSYKSDELSFEEEAIYHSLKVEAMLPIRIVWGYNGFSNEFNFRESFFNHLNENVSSDLENRKGGFGPHNFPNIIICGNYSMVKLNGMPFGHPIDKNFWWNLYATSSYNPTYFFLEAIWTRLSYKYQNLPMEIFGDDLSIEPLKLYLDCRMQKLQEDHLGWEFKYNNFSEKSLNEHKEVANWSPTFIDKKQFVMDLQQKTGL